MKKTIILFLLLMVIQNFNANISAQENENKEFNAELAKKLNADDYGMKKYVMALLKSGPNRSKDSITRVELQNAHMANIVEMAEQGVLVMAGPFFGDGEIRGIYVFNVETLDEAKKLTETDPLIKSGGLIMELHLWYGSAALQEMGGIHKTISKKEI